LRKKLVIPLLALLTVAALVALVGSVNAAGPNGQVSISASTQSVGQAATYTITVNNAGQTSIGAINVTIPYVGTQGYKDFSNPTVTQEPSSQNWNISIQSNYITLVGSGQGLSRGQSVTFTFDATNPQPAATYKWVIGVSENATESALSPPEASSTFNFSINISAIDAAFLILFIAVIIAFINTSLNRVLINYFVGWEQYRVMQKEMNEYRQETMAAARANDKKQMEKLKKRQSQINNMQSKMLKPQMVQLAISAVYFVIWIWVLIPTFQNKSMIYLPGLGALSVVYWYPICSFFLSILASRILGIMPIET